MSPSKPFQMRLDDATRARWQAAAGADGSSLARFVKDAVEEKIAGEVVLPPQIPRAPKQTTSAAMSGGKVFRGPDPKGGKK